MSTIHCTVHVLYAYVSHWLFYDVLAISRRSYFIDINSIKCGLKNGAECGIIENVSNVRGRSRKSGFNCERGAAYENDNNVYRSEE